jgi:hypothetical protein
VLRLGNLECNAARRQCNGAALHHHHHHGVESVPRGR